VEFHLSIWGEVKAYGGEKTTSFCGKEGKLRSPFRPRVLEGAGLSSSKFYKQARVKGYDSMLSKGRK